MTAIASIYLSSIGLRDGMLVIVAVRHGHDAMLVLCHLSKLKILYSRVADRRNLTLFTYLELVFTGLA